MNKNFLIITGVITGLMILFITIIAFKTGKTYKFLVNMLQAVFCETKKGGKIGFSMKKFTAWIFISLSIYSRMSLIFQPKGHWITELTATEVDSSVIIAIVASMDALTASALAVYSWAKVKGGA